MIVNRVCMAAAAFVAVAVNMGTALADPRPLLVPSRDVVVAYQVLPGDNQPIDVRVAIKAGGTRLRITSDALPTLLVVNRDTEKAAIMLPLLHAYSDIKIGRYDPEQTVLKGATFTHKGHSRVAGYDCNVWRATSSDGDAEACITPDGVILRGTVTNDKHGKQATITATNVNFGPVPDADFEVPADYQRSPFKLSVNGFGK